MPALAPAAGFVPVPQDGDVPGAAVAKQQELLGRNRPAHEPGNGHAHGVQPERRPVPLDEDDVVGVLDPVQVEQHPAFLEFGRQPVPLNVFRQLLARPAAGIGDELAGGVMDRDADASRHNAAAAIAEAKLANEFGRDAALGEVRVLGVELESESQRRVYGLA